MAGLDDILNGTEETETETVTETEETEQAEETQQEETGEQETTASQVAAETETATEPEEVKGLKAAAAAERKKRQELEAEREALRQEAEQLRQQLAQRQPQDEEPYIDPDVAQQLTQTRSELQQALVNQKWEMSEVIVREQHADFDDKLDTFKEMLKADPALYNKMLQQPLPAKWMYQQATEHQQLQKFKEIGDPAKYEADLAARLREQIKAELLAEQEAEKKAATEAAIRAKLPKSGFAEERSSGTARATTKTYTGPTPLKSILG